MPVRSQTVCTSCHTQFRGLLHGRECMQIDEQHKSTHMAGQYASRTNRKGHQANTRRSHKSQELKIVKDKDKAQKLSETHGATTKLVIVLVQMISGPILGPNQQGSLSKGDGPLTPSKRKPDHQSTSIQTPKKKPANSQTQKRRPALRQRYT